MVLPILAGIALVTLVGTGRAAFRAYRRLGLIPPNVFLEAVNAKPAAHGDRARMFLGGGFQDKMTYGEALEILGLDAGSSRADILQRHRKIIMANHPDKGGSNYFASKINEAKDVLLKQASR